MLPAPPAVRGDQFAAMVPSAAAAPSSLGKLKPKPVLRVAGGNDPLVEFAWQQQTRDGLRMSNWREVDLSGVRVERLRHFGQVDLRLALWRRLELPMPLQESAGPLSRLVRGVVRVHAF